MAMATAVECKTLFPYSRWNSQLPQLAREYSNNQPCPHILLHDFVDEESARVCASEFPEPSSQAWIQYKHQNENKLGLAKREMFPRHLGQITDELNSPDFVQWLSELSGIPGLVADPSLEGGGLHQSTRNGFLNVHADFSMHHYHKNWRRRVNLILYLNPDWQPHWGGAIELWDKEMKSCVAQYPPFLNDALIFNTNEESLHGFPDPIQCPGNVSRKSLALYYYTVEDRPASHPRSTDYRARPTDGLKKSTLIWLDKVAVDVYSRAKARFGFSDEYASKVLGLFSGRK